MRAEHADHVIGYIFLAPVGTQRTGMPNGKDPNTRTETVYPYFRLAALSSLAWH